MSFTSGRLGVLSSLLVSALMAGGITGLATAPALAGPGGPAPVCGATACTETYAYTGSLATFVVPANVNSVQVVVAGGQGGAHKYGAAGGSGGDVTGNLSVTPSDSLQVLAGAGGSTFGGGGQTGSGGGAGGGGSFVFTSGGTPLLAAGGGGGGGLAAHGGYGSGATTTGGTGAICSCNSVAATLAQGGSQTAPGAAGNWYNFNYGSSGSGPAANTSPGVGGNGGQFLGDGGGAGGGGYYGGGGGGVFEGGGGGSGYADPSVTAVTSTDGANGGNGWVSFTWQKAPSTTNLSVSPPTESGAGTTLTLTATVAADGGTPTGSVDFLNGASTISGCTGQPLDGTGTATCTATLPSGPATLTASYLGDTTYAVSQSSESPYTVYSPLQITTSSLPDATFGSAYTSDLAASGGKGPYSWTATAGSLPAGLTLSTAGVLSGTPTETGAFTAHVVLLDSLDPAETTSADLPLTVDAAAQTITFVPLTSPAAVGDTQNLSAEGGASGNPVTFAVADSTTGSACSISGTTLSFDHAGSCVVVADQAGTADYAAATEATQTVTVDLASTSVSVALNPGEAAFGQPVTATATVGGDQAGSVQFSVDGTDLGAPVGVSDGQATSPALGLLAPGSYQVGAVFTPLDATKYAPSSSSPQTLVVDQAATTSTITIQPDTLTATIAPVSSGSGTPTGTVTFSVDGTTVGTAPLSAGVATLNYSLPTDDAHSVAVQYSGDSDFLASSASTARFNPTVTASLTSAHPKTASGWYRNPVTVQFTCTPNGAALTAPCPQPVTLTGNGAAQSVSRTISAVDGGIGTVSVTGINIDQTRPTVVITGVATRLPYLATAPVGSCVAHDGLSGVASCSISRHRSGRMEIYVATAKDKAGNVSTARVTALTNDFVIQGAPFSNGAYVVHAGRTYTVLAVAVTRPRYVDAALFPTMPRTLDHAFIKTGHNRWALGVTFSNAMLHHRYWYIGVRVGGRTHVLKVHVVR
ncbi:MAG: hypothetical protein JWR52_2519 [Marmoricola sp.]|nr:hypothetical protein [Marmoricola sp.]